ncbi:MAG TPA: hypothetical protein VGN07_21140 [Steroidobacteraceae bacterium]
MERSRNPASFTCINCIACVTAIVYIVSSASSLPAYKFRTRLAVNVLTGIAIQLRELFRLNIGIAAAA